MVSGTAESEGRLPLGASGADGGAIRRERAIDRLSTRSFDLVLRLCEQRQGEIAGHVMRMHFGGVGDELIAAGALVEMALSEIVFMPIDLDDLAVAFEWEPELQAHAAFHPADGWVHANRTRAGGIGWNSPGCCVRSRGGSRVPATTRSACSGPRISSGTSAKPGSASGRGAFCSPAGSGRSKGRTWSATP